VPIYEYRRPDGTTFEVVQAFSDDPLSVDPETGVPVERVLHPPAVHFKGTGFYNTDYGTRKRNRETAAAGERPSGDKDSSATGGEASKPSGEAAASAKSASDGGSSAKDAKGAKTAKKEASGSRSKRARSR
jgi:predicted nucleic acid-binding Zn ribbon protein